MTSRLILLAWLLSSVAGWCSPSDKRLNTLAPEWSLDHWIQSEPLKLSDLKGKVVLIRWWTAPQCPYCRNTAPALNEFYERYKDRGLVVVGIYHHKSSSPLDPNHVKKYTEQYGFKFPVATDTDWKSLKEWWLKGNDSGWTSVSFLLDRNGRIQFIHPGGQYVKGDGDYEKLELKIQELLMYRSK